MPQDLCNLYFSNTYADSTLIPELDKKSSKVHFRRNCFVVCNKTDGKIYYTIGLESLSFSSSIKDVEVVQTMPREDIVVIEFPAGPNTKLKEQIERLPTEYRPFVRRAKNNYNRRKNKPNIRPIP